MKTSRRIFSDSLVILALLVLTGAGAIEGNAASRSQSAYYPIYLPLAQNNHPGQADLVTILNNASYYTDWLGKLHIVGETSNLSSHTAYNVWVTARLYNRNGAQVGSASGVILLDDLRPGDQGCFNIEFDSPASDWYTYDFQEPNFEIGADHPGLTLDGVRGYMDRDSQGYENYIVYGDVRNTSGARVNNVQAVATLYDRNGKVISCSSDYIDTVGLALDTGDSAPFEVYFWDRRDYDEVADFRVEASCFRE